MECISITPEIQRWLTQIRIWEFSISRKILPHTVVRFINFVNDLLPSKCHASHFRPASEYMFAPLSTIRSFVKIIFNWGRVLHNCTCPEPRVAAGYHGPSCPGFSETQFATHPGEKQRHFVFKLTPEEHAHLSWQESCTISINVLHDWGCSFRLGQDQEFSCAALVAVFIDWLTLISFTQSFDACCIVGICMYRHSTHVL